MSSPVPQDQTIPAHVRRRWHKKKCILMVVGSVATVLVLLWKGPAASVMYLFLVFWSFAVFEIAVLAKIYASRSFRVVGRQRLISNVTIRATRPAIQEQLQQSEIPRPTNVAGQDLSRSAQEHRASNNTIVREHALAARNPSPSTESSLATTRAAPETPDSAQLLSGQTSIRRWASKRPATPIAIKPSQLAEERYVSPMARRPLAPVNMQQRHNDRSSTNAATRQDNPTLPMGMLPKPWPRSKVDGTTPNRRPLSAAPCHPDAHCSRSGSSCNPFFTNC